MSKARFEVVGIGSGRCTINDGGRTVAFVTPQGYIDWLLKSPMQEGPLLTSIRKDTHLSYTLGLKILLITPTPPTLLKDFSYRIEDGGSRLVLTGLGETPNGRVASETTASLHVDESVGRYEWEMETIITNRSDKPITATGLEYNNVYPGKTGRCMLYAPSKEYNCTLMVDRDNTAWKFPHQHQLHYSRKINTLTFARGSMAGFFGEETGSPVVIVKECSEPPDWAICDMYYDLHCCARPAGALEPGESWRFRYTVKYLGKAESAKVLASAKPIPIDAEDRKAYEMPRLELGVNRFDRSVNIDQADDASAFRPRPPKFVWDRDTGHSTRGSLRITNDRSEEAVWSAAPPSQIPDLTRLSISGMVRTQNVDGKGVFIRVRYHTFVWYPTPHVEWVKTLESTPVTGTTPGWVRVAVPELAVPGEHFDYLVWIDMVLEGKGVAWLTDVDVDLQTVRAEKPSLEQGSSKSKLLGAGKSSSSSGTAF